ncbi:MAG TPA: 4-alpha-glucanotransferase, partial [Actinomycetota bacterium]|nr:4-alpha-glucanotransferase [Actinomycetota bacterium]
VAAGDATLVGVLGALGVDASTPSLVARELRRPPARMLEPVLVAWDGRLPDAALTVRGSAGRRATVRIVPTDADGDGVERRVGIDGSTLGLAAAFPEPLAQGYHRLELRAGRREGSATVIAAPRVAPGIGEPTWGVFAPLHAIRGPDDWGVGSFTDLERMQTWLRARGGDVLATLPMLAAFLDEPFEPSPYSPASRLFWNELHVDVTNAPGIGDSPEARRVLDDVGFRRELDELRKGALVDHRRAMAAKRRVLAPLAESVLRARPPASFRRWLDQRDGAVDFARFRAEVDLTRTWWGDWDAPARDGHLPGDPMDDELGRYHLYVQWAADLQIDRIATGAGGGGLYLDLPLGVNGASYDVWRHRAVFATGASAGAPPDMFFTGGQDWGFPPMHPERSREDGYGYAVACIRQLLRSASVLRIDHVMGLHRLYWIPRGLPPTAGAYVRSRPDEWYAILNLEATRAGAIVVGEDLGTVPAEVRRAMSRHGVHRSYVVQYEARPGEDPLLPDPPGRSLATTNTHDMVPWAAWAHGDDVGLSVELGMTDPGDGRVAREQRRATVAQLRSFLRERGFRPGRGEHGLLEATLAFLAASDAAVVVATLDDLWGERRPQNVPGTTDRPNWRVRHEHTLDALDDVAGVDAALRRIAAARDRASVIGTGEAGAA